MTVQDVTFELPTDPADRKALPLASGCYDYFPDAIYACYEISTLPTDFGPANGVAYELLLGERGVMISDARIAMCALRLVMQELTGGDPAPLPHSTSLIEFLDAFAPALLAVAALSKAGNDQHNPGEPMHWARSKSTDQSDTIARHLLERGKVDIDGHRHSVKSLWRSFAQLQLTCERTNGRPMSRGSRA
jgi:hypothetical protein